jgi:hypothetical protein
MDFDEEESFELISTNGSLLQSLSFLAFFHAEFLLRLSKPFGAKFLL